MLIKTNFCTFLRPGNLVQLVRTSSASVDQSSARNKAVQLINRVFEDIDEVRLEFEAMKFEYAQCLAKAKLPYLGSLQEGNVNTLFSSNDFECAALTWSITVWLSIDQANRFPPRMISIQLTPKDSLRANYDWSLYASARVIFRNENTGQTKSFRTPFRKVCIDSRLSLYNVISFDELLNDGYNLQGWVHLSTLEISEAL